MALETDTRRIFVSPGRLADAIRQYLEYGTRDALATQAGCPTRYLYNILEGKYATINLDLVDRLCLAMQIPLDDVLECDDAAEHASAGDAWCRSCRSTIGATTELRCPWCDTSVSLGAKRGKKFDRHFLRITPELMRHAYQLHASGASIREAARIVFPSTTYASEKSCAVSLAEAWKKRGWRTRSHKVAMTRFNQRNTVAPPKGTPEWRKYRHELRVARGETRGVMCQATTSKAAPCKHAALRDGIYCRQHEPSLADARKEEMRRMRAAIGRSALNTSTT